MANIAKQTGLSTFGEVADPLVLATWSATSSWTRRHFPTIMTEWYDSRAWSGPSFHTTPVLIDHGVFHDILTRSKQGYGQCLFVLPLLRRRRGAHCVSVSKLRQLPCGTGGHLTETQYTCVCIFSTIFLKFLQTGWKARKFRRILERRYTT